MEEIDDALAYFMREIRRSPVFENTNFIFTSDHGMVELDPDELGFRGWVGTLSLCKMAFARVSGRVVWDYVAALRDPSRSPRGPCIPPTSLALFATKSLLCR